MNLTYRQLPFATSGGQIGYDFDLPSTPMYPGGIVRDHSVGGSGIGGSSSPTVIFTPPPPPPLRTTSTVQTIANQVNQRLNLDQIFALGSQAIAAWGKNPTQQIGGLTVQTISPAQTGYAPQQTAAPQYQQLPNGQVLLPNGQVMTPGQTVGTGAASAIDGVFSFVQNNLLLVGALAVGGILLFKQPPGRR